MSPICEKFVVVVPAAGVGKRMKAQCPKQYLSIDQQTILEHTAFRLLSHPLISHVVIAISEGDEYFNIYLKIGDETICHRIWDAKLYPPKTRYTVDVRPHLKKLLRELTDTFSSENLTYKYMEHSLIHPYL